MLLLPVRPAVSRAFVTVLRGKGVLTQTWALPTTRYGSTVSKPNRVKKGNSLETVGDDGVPVLDSKRVKGPKGLVNRTVIRNGDGTVTVITPRSTKKTKILVQDLPRQAVDSEGKALPALQPWNPPTKRTSKSKSSSSKTPKTIRYTDSGQLRPDEEEWRAAVQSGVWPDTDLARDIWTFRQAYPDALLLTRVGMFYESYFDQAPLISSLLQIRLTAKSLSSRKYPLCGFPYLSLPKFLPTLLAAGHSIVTVEERQPDDPNASARAREARVGDGKERFVDRVWTRGTAFGEGWDGGEYRYLLGLAVGEGKGEVGATEVGLAYIDVAADRAMVTRTSTLAELEHELASVGPAEVVLPKRMRRFLDEQSSEERGRNKVETELLDQLKSSNVHISFAEPSEQPTGHHNLPPIEQQATALTETHLKACLLEYMPLLLPPNHQSPDTNMRIDASTLLGLEIRQSIRGGLGLETGGQYSSAASKAGTLLGVIKRTITPSGTRLLVNTLSRPSADLTAIRARHDLVEIFHKSRSLREDLRDELKNIVSSAQGNSRGEVGRILRKFLGGHRTTGGGFGGGLGFGRDLWDLKVAIQGAERIRRRLQTVLWEAKLDGLEERRLGVLLEGFRAVGELEELLGRAINEAVLNGSAAEVDETEEGEVGKGEAEAEVGMEVPMSKQEEDAANKAALWWVNPDFSESLKRLHQAHKELLAKKEAMQSSLRQQYGCSELTLGTNKMGHLFTVNVKSPSPALLEDSAFISVTAGKGFKRFLYNDWNALGGEISVAAEAITSEQRKSFDVLRSAVCKRQEDLSLNAALIDEIDLTLGFAQAAEDLGWVRPELDESTNMDVVNGRHPTVQHALSTSASARSFVPNSLHFSPSTNLHIITGCNMGGKSTILRQTAIITILAQSGSFVPADAVRMGIVDAVFSRVGARDELFKDRSTFMVEMHEAAYILRHATSRSLIIMDEIGRGTAPSAGLAIAYATIDELLRRVRCRTLFATHFHDIEGMLVAESPQGTVTRDGVQFWCTDMDEVDGRFSYSYKLRPGVNRESHAIRVAAQAGMPSSFLESARNAFTMIM